jgi:formylglycine-generating enzyme required for sulfatase activity
MVIVPAGEFLMGSPDSEPGREPWQRGTESPQVKVTKSKPFAVGRFAVTFAEWDACVADGACNGYKADDQGWGRGKQPVINVSWHDAKSYVAWIAKKTGENYRLLSEAECEYVTRAGTTTPFWWGREITPAQANYNGEFAYEGGGKRGENRQRTLPVESFQPNPWGLYNVHGNVFEWTEDCWNDSLGAAPSDGSARTSGDCGRSVLRGGCHNNSPDRVRAAIRLGHPPSYRANHVGFRIARSIGD